MTEKKEQELIYKLLSSPLERVKIFREIPENKQGFIILNLPKRIQKKIMDKLSDRELIEMIDYLDPTSATDLLQIINKKRANRVLKKLGQEIRKKIEFLLRFNPKTAAGLMSLDYIEIDKDISFGELYKIVKEYEKKRGKPPAILVVREGFLIGEIPFYRLALVNKEERARDYIKKVPSVKYDEDEKAVIETFKSHPHDKIVVLDDDGSILGIIYSDDVLKLLKKASVNDLQRFAGVSEEEDVLDPPLVKVKNRYRWLIINLATAFLAASVVSLFQKTISAYVLLAVYMPIVAGMGGNAGTQTLAVMVRGLALKEIEPKRVQKVIINEMVAGGINGIINGGLVALVATLWNKSPMLGLIVAIAMIVNLVIAGFFGALIPLIMKKLGKDPASSATIFITTATDVCGFFAFLGLANLFL